jgi:GTP pyrophosphokinase
MEETLKIKAYQFAKIAMVGKKRYSGETFEEHGIKTAKILERFHVSDPITLSAAILHHVVVDGAADILDIEKEFGKEVSEMLKTLESLRILKMGNVSNKEFVESLRRMFLVLAKDLRVVLIKLADLLDNLSTLKYVSEEKQKRVAEETLEIFAPLAERLGMGVMKGEMQDLAFPFLLPKEYETVKKLLKKSTTELEKDLSKVKLVLSENLDKENIDYHISSRAKHLYSLYTKLKRPEVDFDISKVNDLIAFRVITQSLEDCYRVLGVVHKLWRPIPDQFTDFIANPKQNGYQSIHTKVLGPGNKAFEIQIRTEKMHEAAEYGVAAHWSYAEAKSSGVSSETLEKGVVGSTKLDWVQRLAKWQEEVVDNEEFLKSVKTDFFGERIYVFTPKGDVKDLPSGATPVDFAYSVHSDLGDLATGARVNGKLVSLDTKLANTDVCEILVSKNAKKPNRDWLKFVVTGMAKKKIKKAYL